MVFKIDHLFGGNGARPSIGGGMSLAAALVGVEQAGQALQAARSAAKAAARREGRSIKNLFSDGRFVSRASAERWCEQVRNEGASKLGEAILRVFNDDGARPAKPGRLSAWRAKFAGSGFLEALAVGDYEEAAAICSQASKADQILRAGKRARMSADAAGEVPQPTGLAEKIIEAGKRRRGEV
jgi:hypothetical protein